MAGGKTHHAADAAIRLGGKKLRRSSPGICGFVRPVARPGGRLFREQGGKIVVEDKGRGVLWIAAAASSRVARAQVALRVIVRAIRRGRILNATLPGAGAPLWRDEDPIAG